MEHSNQNKNIQQQLNEMNSLPAGISFNSETAWQKIENNLKPEQKRKVVAWYFAAASILVICLLFIFIGKDKTNQKIAGKTVIKKDKIALKVKPAEPLITLTKTSSGKAIVVEKIKDVLSGKKNTTVYFNKKDDTATLHQLAIQPKAIDDTLLKIQNEFLKNNKNNTAVVVVNNKLTRPKLKVLHLNELGEEVEVINQQEKSKLNTAWFFPNKNQSADNNYQPSLPTKKSIFTITLSSKNNN